MRIVCSITGEMASRSLGSPVLDGEVLRILFILFQEYEKPSSLDPQDLLDIGSCSISFFK